MGTRGLRTRQCSSVSLSFYDRTATCVNVLSLNVRLYCCRSQSALLYTQQTLFTPDYAISHYLLAFFIYSSLCKPKNSLFFGIQDYKRNKLFALRSKGQRLNANSVETLSLTLCVQAIDVNFTSQTHRYVLYVVAMDTKGVVYSRQCYFNLFSYFFDPWVVYCQFCKARLAHMVVF